jgi:hypothetical protein
MESQAVLILHFLNGTDPNLVLKQRKELQWLDTDWLKLLRISTEVGGLWLD